MSATSNLWLAGITPALNSAVLLFPFQFSTSLPKSSDLLVNIYHVYKLNAVPTPIPVFRNAML